MINTRARRLDGAHARVQPRGDIEASEDRAMAVGLQPAEEMVLECAGVGGAKEGECEAAALLIPRPVLRASRARGWVRET